MTKEDIPGTRHAWIDASAGIAGDMLLAALVDAGAELDVIQRAVDAVIPDAVSISARDVTRAGQRALKIDIQSRVDHHPDRRWSAIETRLTEAELSESVRGRALAVFSRLASAEAAVHGISAAAIHFHEVGAWDSIADIVGISAALDDLSVDTFSAGPVSVGAGRVRTAHGELPVPVPAVVELAHGWRIQSGGDGELTTPTGMAVLASLAERCEDLPALDVNANGVGAGNKDTAGRPNVTRILIGTRDLVSPSSAGGDRAVLLEANIDDFDARLWPGVLTALLAAGAADAWLVPIIMKKGRPAHQLGVLARPDQAPLLRTVMLQQTSSIGIRQTPTMKYALPRGWIDLELASGSVPIKIAHRDGIIWQVSPEFDDLERLATRSRTPTARLLEQCQAAMAIRGLVPGAPVPKDLVGYHAAAAMTSNLTPSTE